LRRLAVALIVLASVAAGCSHADPEIAGIEGTVIHLSEVRGMYQTDVPVDDGFRATLFAQMAVIALEQALQTDYGLTVDSAAVEDYYSQLVTAIAEASATPADLVGVENASMEMVHFNAEVLALRDAAVAELVKDPEALDAVLTDAASMTTVCVQHILVATQEEADAVVARLQAGEDFATVANEVSLDTYTDGGDLGCSAASDYVGEFAQATLDAPLGEIYGPVETSYGYHVLIVSSRTEHTRAEYDTDAASLLSDTQLSALWGNWIDQVLQGVGDAWVDPAYGTWTAAGIDPPASETTTTSASETTTTVAETTTTAGTTSSVATTTTTAATTTTTAATTTSGG
jgi:hypothetical protein